MLHHTPGPWRPVCEDTINGMPASFRIDAAGGVVALLNTIGSADARLIAAAPDMLAALQAVARLLDDPEAPDMDADRIARLVGAVIEQATGEG